MCFAYSLFPRRTEAGFVLRPVRDREREGGGRRDRERETVRVCERERRAEKPYSGIPSLPPLTETAKLL